MLFLFLAACTGDDNNGFLSGSGRYENTPFGATDTGGDTGDTGGGEVGGEGAPVIGEVKAGWDEYPNYGMVLEVEISFTDDGEDIVGGVAFVDVFQPGEELAYSGNLDVVDIAEVDEPEPKTCYLLDDSTIFFAIDNLDETEDTWMTIELKDASGNISTTVEASVDGE